MFLPLCQMSGAMQSDRLSSEIEGSILLSAFRSNLDPEDPCANCLMVPCFSVFVVVARKSRYLDVILVTAAGNEDPVHAGC